MDEDQIFTCNQHKKEKKRQKVVTLDQWLVSFLPSVPDSNGPPPCCDASPGSSKRHRQGAVRNLFFPFICTRAFVSWTPPRSGSQQRVPQRAGIAEFMKRSISLHTFVWLHPLLPTMPTGSRVRTRIEIVLHTLESIIVCQTVIHLSSIGCFV